MPETGVQRGPLNIQRGDFLTQGYPALGKIWCHTAQTTAISFQAVNAQNYGAIGLIIYSDPANCVRGTNSMYLDGWMMPETGVQGGSLKMVKETCRLRVFLLLVGMFLTDTHGSLLFWEIGYKPMSCRVHAPPYRTQFFCFQIHFSWKAPVLGVHAPLMGPCPPYGKSWIHHW